MSYFGETLELSIEDDQETIIEKVKDYSAKEGYSYSNLTHENKEFVLGYAFALADVIHSVNNKMTECDFDKSLKGQLEREVVNDFSSEVIEHMGISFTETFVSILDSQRDLDDD